MASAYEGYTIARYNETVRRIADRRLVYGIAIALSIVATTFIFPLATAGTSDFDSSLRWLTLTWLLSPPILGFSAWVYFTWFRPQRFVIEESRLRGPVPGEMPLVIFQITTTGENAKTVANSARSVLHWTQRHPEVCFTPLVWIVCEEFGYLPNKATLDSIRDEGARLIVTPKGYQTPLGTTRKGRALQYAVEVRRQGGLRLDRTWVYHQDDETAVGEDTVLGIDEYVREHLDEKSVACGVILYPQHGEDFRPSMIQELGRTQDDVRTLFSMTSSYNAFSGFHGSHYLARADVEDETGFDIGPDLTSEDLIFETRARAQHGNIFRVLKGFAYEQAAFTVLDQLRQRRRWFQGWWKAVHRLKYPVGRRVVMTYSMLVWMSSLFSLVAMLTSWIFAFHAIFALTAPLSGFVWSFMVIRYQMGYEFHRAYLAPRSVGLWRIIPNGILGALSDAVAPWYGTFTRQPRTFQLVTKDAPRPSSTTMSPTKSVSA